MTNNDIKTIKLDELKTIQKNFEKSIKVLEKNIAENVSNKLKPIIISTGMSTMGEIKESLGVIAYGLLKDKITNKPSRLDFKEAFSSLKGQKLLKEKKLFKPGFCF